MENKSYLSQGKGLGRVDISGARGESGPVNLTIGVVGRHIIWLRHTTIQLQHERRSIVHSRLKVKHHSENSLVSRVIISCT